MTLHRPSDRPSAPQAYECKITQSMGMATQMQLKVILREIAYSHRRLVKQRQLKSQQRRKRTAEIVSVSVLSKVFGLEKLSCPQIWNIEQEKDRETEKVGGRLASEV